MKQATIFLLLALYCGALPLFGQLQPKTLFATGGGSLFSDLERYSLRDYDARAGILIDENLTLGGFIHREHYDRFSDAGPDVTLQYQGLFTRYFFQSNKQIVPFLSGEVFFGSRDGNYDIDELDFNRSLWGWRLSAGADWFLSPSTAIEAQAGFRWFDEENRDARTDVLARISLFFFLPPEGESLGRATLPLTEGLLLVGGQGSFRWRLSDEDTGSDPVIRFQPVFGYQFHPRWLAGAEFRFTSGEQETGGGVTTEAYDLSVGLFPFLRLYINPDDKFKVFAEGMAGGAFQRSDFNNEYPFRLRGSAGLDFFLSSTMALEAFFGYQAVKDLDADLGWGDSLVGGVGLRAFVGE